MSIDSGFLTLEGERKFFQVDVLRETGKNNCNIV
jgi:hypothetical protein